MRSMTGTLAGLLVIAAAAAAPSAAMAYEPVEHTTLGTTTTTQPTVDCRAPSTRKQALVCPGQY